MNIASRLLFCSATLGLMVQLATGCANVTAPDATGSGSGGGKGSGGNRGGTGSTDGGAVPPPDLQHFEALPAAGACGNNMQDPGEECDDGNGLDAQNSPDKQSDGCTRLCQIEAGWKCPQVGKCDPPQCGDGILAASEACDDSNTNDGDGCSKDCKTIDDKFECRVPGKRCVPKCGDGHKVGSENCDDGNTNDGDGCSSLCLQEPGSSCDTSKEPSVCTKSNCGNGKIEAGESCDNGNDATNSNRNGVFLGDGKGCSKTCTMEPNCRDKNGKNQACAAVCGDGNWDMGGGEECDDGNHDNGDGCTKDCKTESGFTCMNMQNPDTVPCANGSGMCLELPVTYRDFKSQHETGGHPDFFYHSTSQSCIPNSSGPAHCGDATARCWGIVQNDLLNGKPQLNGSPTCPCQFTDWSVKNDGNHVPGYTMTNSPITTSTSNNSGAPVFAAAAVPIVKSKDSFAQWYNDSAGSSPANMHTVGTIELTQLAGATDRYRFSSDPNSITGGFFPLDKDVTANGKNAAGEPFLCNLWPYWYSSATFGAANGCKGDQYLFPPSIPDTIVTGTDCSGRTPKGCVNGIWVTGLTGKWHDAWFTDEVHYYFTFTNAFDLQFYGDDDMFIFVNGQLTVDLGSIHQKLPGKVSIGDDGNATIIEGGYTNAAGDILPCPSQDPLDPMMTVCSVAAKTTADCRSRTLALGLKKNSTYEIAIFGADRGATESNYQLTLNGFATNKTVCTPRCGDGVTAGAEECDCGDGTGQTPDSCAGQKNDDNVYGGCTTQCKYGAYCGDGLTNGDNEVCDEGKNNGATYSDDPKGATGCSVTCQRPHFCGDGRPDSAFGEQCDLGDKNGQMIDNGGGKTCIVCDSKCQIRPEC